MGKLAKQVLFIAEALLDAADSYRVLSDFPWLSKQEGIVVFRVQIRLLIVGLVFTLILRGQAPKTLMTMFW